MKTKLDFMCFWVACKNCEKRMSCDIDYEELVRGSARRTIK